MPRLDVAICTYNRAAELDRCLHVLRRQSAPAGWRVTVIDNNSTDATAQVIANHAEANSLPGLERIFEAVPGLTAARQRAMRESRADWVAFVDDDCLLRPGWIAAALDAVAAHRSAGALGGRVLPDWGRPPPPHLDRNGWLFAHQDFGEAACEASSLVGAGLVLSRVALARTGWTDKPLLSDRIGRGFVSGGDVEISLRLQASGYQLRYEPLMILDHQIAPERQRMAALIQLSKGLGGGAALASLLLAADLESWQSAEHGELRARRQRHRLALASVVRGRYAMRDWRIFRAFLIGRQIQLASATSDVERYLPLVGACRPPVAVRSDITGLSLSRSS